MGGGCHGVAHHEQHRVAGCSGGEECLGVLLQILSAQDLDGMADAGLERLEGRASQARRVELGEDAICRPCRLEAGEGDVVIVVQPQANELERSRAGTSGRARRPWGLLGFAVHGRGCQGKWIYPTSCF